MNTPEQHRQLLKDLKRQNLIWASNVDIPFHYCVHIEKIDRDLQKKLKVEKDSINLLKEKQ